MQGYNYFLLYRDLEKENDLSRVKKQAISKSISEVSSKEPRSKDGQCRSSWAFQWHFDSLLSPPGYVLRECYLYDPPCLVPVTKKGCQTVQKEYFIWSHLIAVQIGYQLLANFTVLNKLW